jgi:hypothetical protein
MPVFLNKNGKRIDTKWYVNLPSGIDITKDALLCIDDTYLPRGYRFPVKPQYTKNRVYDIHRCPRFGTIYIVSDNGVEFSPVTATFLVVKKK